MASDVSKYCADYLRECYPGLKASHARELVASFFGYKSHAALLADKRNSVEYLDVAAVLIPDSTSIDAYSIHERLSDLEGLPGNLARPFRLVEELTEYLQSMELFSGEVWECDDIGEFVIEHYLPEHIEEDLDFELKDIISTANANFHEIEYDDAVVQETDHGLDITVTGTYSGYSLDDDDSFPEILFEVNLFLSRCAGRISFEEPEIYISGELVVTKDEKIASNSR